MALTTQEYESVLQAEYVWLCQVLSLEPVALVFRHTGDDDLEDPRYGGSPRHIVFPYTNGALLEVLEPRPTAHEGPPTWDTNTAEGWCYWARWRTDLWHEVAHQLQDQVLRRWNPLDGEEGHSDGWNEALGEMASRMNAPIQQLKLLLAIDILATKLSRALAGRSQTTLGSSG